MAPSAVAQHTKKIPKGQTRKFKPTNWSIFLKSKFQQTFWFACNYLKFSRVDKGEFLAQNGELWALN